MEIHKKMDKKYTNKITYFICILITIIGIDLINNINNRYNFIYDGQDKFILCLFSVVLIYNFMKNIIYEYYINNIRFKKIYMLFIGIGSIIGLIICKSYGILDVIVQPYDVSIIATGEKNRNSLGAEVWIVDINGERISSVEQDKKIIQRLYKDETWEYKNEMFVSYQNQPSIMSLSFMPTDKDIIIKFLKHNYSGEVVISSNEINEELDLYDANGDYYLYKVKSSKSYKTNLITWEIIINIICILMPTIHILIIKIIGLKRKENE